MVGVGTSQQSNSASSSGSPLADLHEIRAGLATLTAGLAPDLAVPFAQQVQREFAALECLKIAEMKAAGASERETRNTASAGGTRSKKSANRADRRAEATKTNPGLADDIAAGTLGEEQMDAIASAADKTNGEAATDSSLINNIKNSPADDAGKIASRWLEERDDPSGTESRYKRQRARRSVRFGLDPKTGCESMTALGDRESINELRKLLEARANELYKNDGGREVPKQKHPRTHAQRMYDALCGLLGNSGRLGNSGAATPDPAEPTPGTTTTAVSEPTSAPAVRNMMHVSITVDDDSAAQIRAATVDGKGYLPQSVLEKYACSTMIGGTVFSESGEVLWFGRTRRHATPAQFAALIARDGGCVKCGAAPSRCEAHHVLPFNAPAQGETNIDELALVCSDDHRWIHEQHLTLYWQLGPPDPETGQRNRVWLTRPATAEEIAPERSQGAQRQRGSNTNRLRPETNRPNNTRFARSP